MTTSAPTTTSPADLLDELERLREAATPGPWTADGQAILPTEGYSEWPVVACDDGVVEPADAALIVAAVNRLPDLVAAVRAALDYADLLSRTSGRRPEVLAIDAAHAIRTAVTEALAR